MKTTAASLLIMLGCVAIMPDAYAQEEFANGNTALGHGALDSLTSGKDNTALGAGALRQNTKGNDNTAVGSQSLRNNRDGDLNTAVGAQALKSNAPGTRNVAIGAQAMNAANDPDFNTAVGVRALSQSASAFNIGLGYAAGSNLTADNNICIGNVGQTLDSGTIRIGGPNQVRVFIAGISGARIAGETVQVNAAGQLGLAPSSARFKHEIRSIDTASEAIFALNPVTFCYDQDIDPQAMPQFGLIAEEVAKVNPALVLPDKEGKPITVRYDAVNAMLLNEFLKEHRKNERQEATIAQLRQEIAVLNAGLQKVSGQLELSKSSPQTVLNNR